MIEYNARDPALFERHNIRCEFVGDVGANTVIVEHHGSRASRSLLLSFGGDGNTIRLASVPNGIIHPVLHNSTCHIAGQPGSVQIDLWLYNNAKFVLGEGSVVFGLTAAVSSDTTLTLGHQCLLSDQIEILTGDHHSIVDLETGKQINFAADVTIQDRVWIGKRAMILKGVEIGKGSIIAACSLVTTSIPPKQLWGGAPAKCFRENVSWVGSHPADPGDVRQMLASLHDEPQAAILDQP